MASGVPYRLVMEIVRLAPDEPALRCTCAGVAGSGVGVGASGSTVTCSVGVGCGGVSPSAASSWS